MTGTSNLGRPGDDGTGTSGPPEALGITPAGVTAHRGHDMLRWITAIERLSISVNEQRPLPDLLTLIASTACDLLGYESSGVLLVNTNGDTLRIEGSAGLDGDYLRRVNVEAPLSLSQTGQYADSPSRRAFTESRPILVDDIEADPTYGPWAKAGRHAGHRSMAAVPLFTRGEVVGTVNVYGARPRQLDELGVQLLQVLASHAGIALETSNVLARDRARLRELRDLNQNLNHQQDMLLANARVHETLMGVVARGGGVTETASALTEMTRSPIAVTDLAGRLLASVPYRGLALDITANGPAPQATNSTGPPEAASTEVHVGGEQLGAVWSTISARTNALTTRAIEQGALIVGQDLLRRRANEDAKWQLRGDLLAEIFAGAETDVERIHDRGERIGVDLTGSHVVAAFQLAQADARADTKLPRALRPHLEAAGHGRSLLTHRDGTALVAIPAEGEYGAVRVANRLRKAAASALGTTVRAAISEPVDVAAFPTAKRQVAGLLRLVPHRPHEGILDVGTTGLVGFILADLDPPSSSQLVGRWVEPLRKHDDRHGTSLLATAQSYTRHGLNTAATASELYVHPNTINQRLKRIETTLGAQFSNLDHVTALRTALLLDDVMQHRDQ